MAVARSEHPGVVLGGEIVVLGGLTQSALGRFNATASVESYRPGEDKWLSLPDLPEPRHHSMAAVVGDRLFVVGGFVGSGFEPSPAVWELVGNQWERRPDLPAPVAAGAAIGVEASIFVVGGVPDGGLYRFDIDTGKWVELAAPRSRREHVAAVLLGKSYGFSVAAGGTRSSPPPRYTTPSPIHGGRGASMLEPRSGFGAAAIAGAIYVVGGEVFGPNRALASVEAYDGSSWQRLESLPVGLHGNPLVALGSHLYLLGGSRLAAGVDNDGKTYRLDVGG